MHLTYFTPGPAGLYPTFEKHLKSFVDQQLGSISHRSQQYRDIHKFTVEQLRTLLSIPDTHQILFLGSASEAWERILLNCVEHESYHLVNGSFSKKFYDYALALRKFAHKFEKPMGEGFDFDEITVPEYAEVMCVTHNETSAGVQMLPDDIHKLKQANPDKLLAVDMVSSAPYAPLNYNLVDTAFFSIQKAFGLPAGLGVWIVNEACLAKAEKLRQHETLTIGAHHDLPTLWKNALNFETQATPNVMGIYLLGKIAEDFNRIGIENLRKETEYKAELLYTMLNEHTRFEASVKEVRHQSQTAIVANTLASEAKEVINILKAKGMVVGSGYGAHKNTQIRIANFPANSVERTVKLIEALKIA